MIDWEKIKLEYFTTDTSYRKLAKKYGVNQATIAKRASNENWVLEKQAQNEQKQAELIEFAKEQEIADFKDLLSIDTRLIKLIDRKIKYYENLKDEEMIILDSKTIRGLVTSVSELTTNLRNLNGIPTQSERAAQRIASERLEIERKKAGFDNDGSQEVIIRFEGNVEELEEYGG